MKLERIVALAERVVPCPSAACAILRVLGEASHLDDVVRIIRTDPVLTAKLLSASSTAYFGASREIATLEEAAVVLGHERILRMVLGISFAGLQRSEVAHYGIGADELWHHSLTTAAAAELIARRVDEPFAQAAPLAFTAGLLHDFGKWVLNRIDPGAETDLRSLVLGGKRPVSKAEERLWGHAHAAVGAAILRRWKLPETLVAAVEWHHDPAGSPAPLPVIVHLADYLAHSIGSSYGWVACSESIFSGALERLGLERLALEDLLIQLHGREAEIMGYVRFDE